MEVKPGYKRTEVGVIPEEWEVKRLSEIAKVKGGKRLPTGWFVIERVTANPYLRVTDMRQGGVDLTDIRYVPPEAFEPIKNYRIWTADLFISVAGTLGLVGRIPDAINGANLTENADRITEIECDQDYLLYQLLSERIQTTIEAERTIGAQPKLALNRIENFLIALPETHAEQRAIATALADVDALLTQLDRLIAKKRDIRQAAMQQLLTGKTRLPGFGGEWPVRRLGEHVTFLRNGVHSRAELTAAGRVKYLHYGDIHTSERVRLDPLLTPMPYLPAHKATTLDRLRTGDLVFADASEDMEGVGKSVEIGIIDEDCELVSGLHTIAARFDRSVLADDFKAYLQFCPAFRSQLYRLAAGTKVYAITRNHIASIEIALPSVAEQTAIATLLSDLDAELAALEARREKTRALKQGMMQELLTGRTRLI